MRVRREVTKALELARKDKRIGHSLDGAVTLGVSRELETALRPFEDQLRRLFIVSATRLAPLDEVDESFSSEEVEGLRVRVDPTEDPKCDRCWVHEPTVGEDNRHPGVCRRCAEALQEMKRDEAQ